MLHRETCVLEAAAGAAVLAACEDAVVLAHSVVIPAGGAVTVSLTEQLGNIGLVEGAACGLFFWLFFWLRLLNLFRLGWGLRGIIVPAVLWDFCRGLLLAN